VAHCLREARWPKVHHLLPTNLSALSLSAIWRRLSPKSFDAFSVRKWAELLACPLMERVCRKRCLQPLALGRTFVQPNPLWRKFMRAARSRWMRLICDAFVGHRHLYLLAQGHWISSGTTGSGWNSKCCYLSYHCSGIVFRRVQLGTGLVCVVLIT